MTLRTAKLDGSADQDSREELVTALTQLESQSSSQFRDTADAAAQLESVARNIGAESLAVRARLLRAIALIREGNAYDGGRWAQEILGWAEEHCDSFILPRVHRVMCQFYRQIGDVAEALSHAVQSVDKLSEGEPAELRALHLTALAVTLDEFGSDTEAHQRFQEALTLAGRIGDKELCLNILNNMAYTAYEKDDGPNARMIMSRMLDMRDSAGREFLARELDTVARIEMMGGHFQAVEEALGALLDDGEDSAVQSGDGDDVAVCMVTLAKARIICGRFDDAQSALDAAAGLSKKRGLQAVGVQVRQHQAELHAAAGRFEDAYLEYRAFHAATMALQSAQREARAHALQAIFDVTEARQTSERFREMAHRDALTGLHNRRYLDETLPRLLTEAIDQHLMMSVAIVDLDHFKAVNDTLSHNVGDEVLKTVATLLKNAMIGSITAGRLGGEEFLLILPGLTPAAATAHCENFRRSLESFDWRPITGEIAVTASLGVATLGRARYSASEMLARADRHLYTAKRSGRNQVVSDYGS